MTTHPLLGGVLVGGSSGRMGRPKHLLELGGRTFLQRITESLQAAVEGIAVIGDAEGIPDDAGDRRIFDLPGVRGPMAGMVAAMRQDPRAAWIFVACDLPLITPEATRWLARQRAAGRWAVIPSLEAGQLEPLLALYEPEIRPAMERLVKGGRLAPRFVADQAKVAAVSPPDHLRLAWSNVNTPEDLARAERELNQRG